MKGAFAITGFPRLATLRKRHPPIVMRVPGHSAPAGVEQNDAPVFDFVVGHCEATVAEGISKRLMAACPGFFFPRTVSFAHQTRDQAIRMPAQTRRQ